MKLRLIFYIAIILFSFVYRIPDVSTTFLFDEFSAQLPSLIFGSGVPFFVFIVAKKLFDRNTAIVATLLCILSYFEIIWSRQVSSYVLQQFTLLLSLYIYISLVKKFTAKRFALLLICFALGLISDITFLLFIASLFLHFIYLCFHWNFFNKESMKRFFPYILLLSCLAPLLFFNNYFRIMTEGFIEALRSRPNNVGYYHSFLWKDQTIITFLAVVGVLLNILKYRKGTFLVLVPILIYSTFMCLLFSQYASEYVLPIFPLMLVLAGFAVATIAKALHDRLSLLIILTIVFLIAVNGDAFVFIPKVFFR